MLSEFSKKRLNAFLTDVFIVSMFHQIILNGYFIVLSYYLNLNIGSFSHSNLLFIKLKLWSFIICFIGYFSGALFLGEGQTVGKFIFDLKVIPKQKRPISLSEAFTRSIGYFFCYILGSLPFAIVFFNKRRRGIHCFMSKTKVIALTIDNQNQQFIMDTSSKHSSQPDKLSA